MHRPLSLDPPDLLPRSRSTTISKQRVAIAYRCALAVDNAVQPAGAIMRLPLVFLAWGACSLTISVAHGLPRHQGRNIETLETRWLKITSSGFCFGTDPRNVVLEVPSGPSTRRPHATIALITVGTCTHRERDRHAPHMYMHAFSPPILTSLKGRLKADFGCTFPIIASYDSIVFRFLVWLVLLDTRLDSKKPLLSHALREHPQIRSLSLGSSNKCVSMNSDTSVPIRFTRRPILYHVCSLAALT